MKQILYILLLLPVASFAQLSGKVVDERGRQLEYVLVANQESQAYTYTDKNGAFQLRAASNDTVMFMLAGYQAKRLSAQQVEEQPRLALQRLSHTLQEIEVRPELEKYKEEHEEMLRTYNKTFTDAQRKPQIYGSNGVVVSGLISGLASWASGQKKKDKRFLKDFNKTEAQKLTDLRYNPKVVMSATHTSRDTAILFIRNHPMAADFAEHATSLELLMWIRHNYNQWLDNGMDTLLYRKSSD